MKNNDFTSYPEGYERLSKKLVPWYFRPARKMLMKLFLTILKDG